MKAEFMNPFVFAGMKVLVTEGGISRWELDKPHLVQVDMTRHAVNVVMGVTGTVQGIVVYGMDLAVAKRIVRTMAGQELPLNDDVALSALGELGNLITGQASGVLEESGYPCRVSPPAIVRGTAVRLTVVSIPMVAVPIHTEVGEILIHLALSENEARGDAC
ncbi:MAG: cheX2 [Symbiobacteriaceae bacterium]|jgi:chemotaxis protein CheX|nr:cheX2 [Symbiobacteriaceae bacterium]